MLRTRFLAETKLFLDLLPEFLNHLGILQERGGSVMIRVGGNTQDRGMQSS